MIGRAVGVVALLAFCLAAPAFGQRPADAAAGAKDHAAAVGLQVTYSSFADGTVYPAKIQLDIAAQKLVVTIENSGHKKLGG